MMPDDEKVLYLGDAILELMACDRGSERQQLLVRILNMGMRWSIVDNSAMDLSRDGSSNEESATFLAEFDRRMAWLGTRR